MDKKELKELKKSYKKAVLLEEKEAAEYEAQLRHELSEAEFQGFQAAVQQFIETVHSLGEKVFAKASDVKANMLECDLVPFLSEAKNLGGGAQVYVKRQFDRGIAVRKRAVQDSRRSTVQKPEPRKNIVVRSDITEVAQKPKNIRRTPNQKTAQLQDHQTSILMRELHTVKIKGIEPVASSIPELPFGDFAGKDGQSLRGLTTHPNDITSLKPANAWVACIDESYLGDESDFREQGHGIIAGVIFPADNPLPEIEQLHCTEDCTEEKLVAADRVVERILHHPNCGVLALPARAQELSLGWEDLLAAWTDVLIRLLPFPDDGSEVSVTLKVEPRGEFQKMSDFAPLDFVCMKSLKEAFPARARRLKLSIVPLPKRLDGGLTLNSYPDIVAHTCLMGRKEPTARQRFAASGWDGVCYLSVRPRVVSQMLKCLNLRTPLDADTWAALMSHSATGLVGGLANYFGQRAKSDVAEWLGYLNFQDAHLKSGAISMQLLRRESEWLERFYPASGVPPKSRLVWLIAKLALANHEGKLAHANGDSLRKEFDELCARLYDEFAPLVCDAVLNLAVAYTNAYEFEMALATIQGLLSKDTALVGLAGYGKLLSSEGQHFAFLGMADEAIDRFERAIDCFMKLSDDAERAINVVITRAYLTTTVMDHRPEEALRVLACYLTGDADARECELVDRVTRLTKESIDKFAHHILLRYVVSAEREDVLRKTYRALREQWCEPSSGHPWELIEFYRALLIAPGNERLSHLEKAYRIAVNEGGETVMVIAAVIAGAALADTEDAKWKARFDNALKVAATIPALRENGRYQALVDQPTVKLPGLDLAAKVLPFNFR